MSIDLEARVQVTVDRFSLDLGLDVAGGETVALLGPNGSGKSTTVDVLAGLRPLDDGRVSLGGTVVDDPGAGVFVPAEQRRVGVVFQRYLLFEHLSVLDNVAYGLRRRGRRRSEARRVAADWLDRVGIGELGARRPHDLSGGQAQRVALARALATEPDLLLLDEPLAALDASTRAGVRRVIADHLAGLRCARVLVTHDPVDAVLLADRIVVVEDGRVRQTGTADALRRSPATAYVADLFGTNLLTGRNERGRITIDDSAAVIVAADEHTVGRVLVTIAPSAIALHPSEPHGSPRNAWQTSVTRMEDHGETVRLMLGAPLPVLVDVTPASVTALGLVPGSAVWASVKATEVGVAPA